MIKIKLDVKKIEKRHLFQGAKGTYLDLVLVENKDGEDQYGNAGFVAQEVSKEARDNGEKGQILGNYRIIQKRTTEKPAPVAKKPAPKDDDVAPDDIPF